MADPKVAKRRYGETQLYEALFWISEYPNREPDDPVSEALDLAEFARRALYAYEMREARRG